MTVIVDKIIKSFAYKAHLKSLLLTRKVLNQQPTVYLSSTPVRHNPKYIARRAVLYVPGHDERKIKKIPALNVDCAVLDCEDGVAITKKEEARHNIRSILDEMEFGRTECSVRINSVESGLAEDDFTEIFKAVRLPPTIMIPKVDKIQHVEWVAQQIKKHLKNRQLPDKFRLILFVESAQGLLDLRDICKRAVELSNDYPFVLDGLIFGSDDYCADVGATRTPEAIELLLARQQIVLIAKSFRIQAVDLVYIDYKDLTGLKKQSIEGVRMGFTGKQVIHPGQVPVVQEAFSPSVERINWARELIKLFEEHQISGKGAFTYKGTMIDKPLLLQAQNVLQMAKLVEGKNKPFL
ncbi:citrate lyase subunit beta-like protein, mitochondrial isoform X1 [Centruroides sculpturatus]|uniref:citrate lyase subunit beta-like protein, mitochondrial isoform X1 n=1 Tax=Centruroides sculpturatus TaxID=218467 RepID=UPI000C6ED995|nr:citrate lyase subunit beta-like protein, mitochondrial isoform X1 [Centruroides sculpturatus]